VNGALSHLGGTAQSVALAVLPLVALFLLFQWLFLDLPRQEVLRILKGTALASLGLFLFLLGVGIGFMPFGRAIGKAVGSLEAKWLLLPFGALLGFVTTWGEPAVRVLADQVDDASSGSIRRSLVVYAVCIGVAVAVGLGMLRIGYAIPLLWLLVPGYGIVLCVMWWSEKEFVSIAIDAGGVATGPLANTFLLALALGTSAAAGGRDPLVDGLGLVSLIALAPLVSVMVLGLVVRWKERRKE
jgi:hypothetical protein